HQERCCGGRVPGRARAGRRSSHRTPATGGAPRVPEDGQNARRGGVWRLCRRGHADHGREVAELMIRNLSETLEQLLATELPGVQIEFVRPSEPYNPAQGLTTLNLFLFDIRENVELRSNERVV